MIGIKRMHRRVFFVLCATVIGLLMSSVGAEEAGHVYDPPIESGLYVLTPPAPAAPMINGPARFGVRPGSPFLYTIPASGERPMQFGVRGLPDGLQVDAATGRITAVLDWELCTLGDPLADLGYLGVYWAGGDPARARHNDPTGLDGFPTYDEIVGRYADRSGLDVSGIDYYVAFSCFRLAAISEGVYARYIHGAMGDQASPELLDTFRTAVEELAERALESLGS